MSYIRTKLSDKDKDILQDICDNLENITIRKSYDSGKTPRGHPLRTGTFKQKNARQTMFGKVYYQGKYNTSASSKKYPWMLSLFKEFIKVHNRNFEFDTVYVNKNTIVQRHVDSKNTGESLLVGFGPYTGGQTTLYINGKPKKFHIKSQSLIFNGSEIPHKSEIFKGTRYSLVFFKRRKNSKG
jgi:hypothetical protein